MIPFHVHVKSSPKRYHNNALLNYLLLFEALMHAAIFGNVAAIIQKLYANRVRYHSRANEIKQFIRVHRIEQDLANRLEDYFHTTWSLSGGVDTSEVRY